MSKFKRFFHYIIIIIAIFLTIYISYFEFFYRTDLISYLKIAPTEIYEISITTHNYNRSDFTEHTINDKNEILEFVNKLSSHPIKKKVYRQFKSDHCLTVSYSSDFLVYERYDISIKSPELTYWIDITGQNIIVEPAVANSLTEWFEFIGLKRDLLAPIDSH